MPIARGPGVPARLSWACMYCFSSVLTVSQSSLSSLATSPLVTMSNLAEQPNQTVAASSLFSVSDPNGYAITEYQFWDSTRDATSGHFFLNGVQQAPGTVIDVPASHFGQVTFVTGTGGNS